MRFPMNLLDWLFGEKVTVELGNGQSQTVTKRWWDEMKQRGLAVPVEQLQATPEMSEQEAAILFTMTMMQGMKKDWTSIANGLRSFLRDPVDNEKLDSPLAQYYFVLGAIAIKIQALPNLFPAAQAKRLRGHVLSCLEIAELEQIPTQVFEAYEAAWAEGLQEKRPPIGDVGSVLYDLLKLASIHCMRGTKFKDPLLLMALGGAMVSYGGPIWKDIAAAHRLMP